MAGKRKSILVSGFNTRPLVYSLNRAGYEVYAIDFFGDLDLYPYVKDSLILTEELNADYALLKETYTKFVPQLIFNLLNKYPNINYLIIGSGLDDHFQERRNILNKIHKEKYQISSLNNNIEVIERARNLRYLYAYLNEFDYQTPVIQTLQEDYAKLKYPVVLKKTKGSGGLNIYKVKTQDELNRTLKLLKHDEFDPADWMIQEFIEGIPVSCTVISNGRESLPISINRQIIGEKFVNAPKEFMYCGNVVPANLLEQDNVLIKEITILLANKLNLKGINGFDFVLKNHKPYLMEINPRIPGSIRASEEALGINLLDMYVKSFDQHYWEQIKELLNTKRQEGFVTKLIFFAPELITGKVISKINKLKFIHDMSDPKKNVPKEAPLCSILYRDTTFAASYFGALKIVDKIKEIISNESIIK